MNNESLVIGCLIYGESDILDQLEPKDFVDNHLRSIFESCIEIQKRGDTVDLVTVANAGHDSEYLVTLIDSVHSPHLKHSAINQLKRDRALREAVAFNPKDFQPEELPVKFIEKSQEIQSMLHYESESLVDILAELKKKVPKTEVYMPSLDSLLGDGIERGAVFTVGGSPGDGKTALATHITANLLEQGKRVHFITLEMSRGALLRRIMKAYWKKTDAELDQDLDTAIEMAGALTITQNVNRLSSVITSMHRHTDADLIVVDYLQRIKNPEYKENRVGEIESISGAIANFARQYEVPVLLLAQLNRDYKNMKNDEPQMYNLKGSQAIEADSHYIGLLHNPNAKEESESQALRAGNPFGGFTEEKDRKPAITKDERMLYLRKNRNGTVGVVKFTFNKILSRFES